MKRSAIIFLLFSLTVGAIDPPPCGLVTCKRVYRQFENYIEAYNRTMQGIQGAAAPVVAGPVGVEQAVHDAVVQRVAALEADLKAKGLVEANLQRDKGQLEQDLKKAEAQVLDQQESHGDFKRNTHTALQAMSAELGALKKVKEELEAERKNLLTAVQAETARVHAEFMKAIQKYGVTPVVKAVATAGVQVDYEKPPAEPAVQAVVISEAGARLIDVEVQAGGAQVTKTERDLLHQLWQLLCGDRSDSAPKEYGTEDYEEAIRTVIDRVTETREALAARERDLDDLIAEKERVSQLYQETIQMGYVTDAERLAWSEEKKTLQEDLTRSLKEKEVMHAQIKSLKGRITTYDLEIQMKAIEIERLQDLEREFREDIEKLEKELDVARLDAKEARDSERVFMDKFQEMMRLKNKLEEEKSQLEESVRELTAEGERLDNEEYEEAQELGDIRFTIAQIRSILDDQQENTERKLELVSQKIAGLDG